MNSSPQKIVNELKYAVRARQILRWATISKHTKYSKHLSKEIDTRVQENLKTLENMIWNRSICMSVYVSAGAVPALVSLLSSSKGNEAEHAAGALCNIVAGNATCMVACVSAGVVPALVKLMPLAKYYSPRLTLIFIANHSPKYRKLVIDAGFNPR